MARYVWKIVIIGDPAVGKTSIRRKYLGETTLKEYIYTVGADFATKRIKLGDELTVQYQIFDLAGQQKFDKVRASFYSGAQAAILVYDVTDKQTLKNLPKWVNEAKKNSKKRLQTFVVVGNKIDLQDEIETTEDDVQKFVEVLSKQMGEDILHIYTSALTGENIDLLFQKLTEKMLEVVGEDKSVVKKVFGTTPSKKEPLKELAQKSKDEKRKMEVKTATEKKQMNLDEKVAKLEKEIIILKNEIEKIHLILNTYFKGKKDLIDHLEEI